MDFSGKPHAPAILPSRNDPSVPNDLETQWAPESLDHAVHTPTTAPVPSLYTTIRIIFKIMNGSWNRNQDL
jgi:hypothetical protein